MCGRYELCADERTDELGRVIAQVRRRHPGVSFQTGEIRPTDLVPVVFLKNGRVQADLMRWGFTALPAKGNGSGTPSARLIINARAESASQKAMFRTCLSRRRCVIGSTAFFEWSHDDQKTKYRFRLSQDQALYMAGLYERYEDGDHFVILTTAANESMISVHNRMPLILTRDQVRAWLTDEAFALSFLQSGGTELIKEPADCQTDGKRSKGGQNAASGKNTSDYEQLSLKL